MILSFEILKYSSLEIGVKGNFQWRSYCKKRSGFEELPQDLWWLRMILHYLLIKFGQAYFITIGDV